MRGDMLVFPLKKGCAAKMLILKIEFPCHHRPRRCLISLAVTWPPVMVAATIMEKLRGAEMLTLGYRSNLLLANMSRGWVGYEVIVGLLEVWYQAVYFNPICGVR